MATIGLYRNRSDSSGAYFHDYTFTSDYATVLLISEHERSSETGGMTEEASHGYYFQSSRDNLTRYLAQYKKISSTTGSLWQIIMLTDVHAGDTLTMQTKTSNYTGSYVFIMDIS